jgi:ComF family protein
MEVKQLIFSGACFFCLAKTNDAWCIDCEQDIMRETPRCPVCARMSTKNNVCGACLKQKPLFDNTQILFNYQYPVNRLIKAFKFNSRPELAKCFAERLANKLMRQKPSAPEIIVPVPLHNKRQRARGYNQSLELARQLGHRLGSKVSHSLCSRTKNTGPQSTQSMKTRGTNVKNAFALSEGQIPKHIAIMDDVITTGSTVNELASLFKKAGCRHIDVWAVART